MCCSMLWFLIQMSCILRSFCEELWKEGTEFDSQISTAQIPSFISHVMNIYKLVSCYIDIVDHLCVPRALSDPRNICRNFYSQKVAEIPDASQQFIIWSAETTPTHFLRSDRIPEERQQRRPYLFGLWSGIHAGRHCSTHFWHELVRTFLHTWSIWIRVL